MNEPESDPKMENKCPQCGATLPTGALGGLCPACLLKQGAAPETSAQPETAPFQPPSLEEIARMFPQLEILAFIGKGGMGAVYKARQPALDRVVALKILPPQTASESGFAERFNREARALARLNHPNIVAVHEFGQVNGMPFFIMEFVDGLNLRQLERAGKLSPREALQIVPPSRKVEVDVRLDDVVLRALEKEPERRYQQASQVKTAVETIASTTKPSPGAAAEASGKILAQDYVLDIGSCLRRGWGLVRSDFWPIVGISALMLLLVQA